MEESDVARAWEATGHIVSQAAFQQEIDAFVSANCEYFEDTEENKFEYTTLHNQYIELAERRIESSLQEVLGPSFSMEAFMNALPPFLEGLKCAEESDDVDFATTLEVLNSFTDFMAFKTMMLTKKQSMKGVEVSPIDVTLSSEMEEMGSMVSDKGNWQSVKQEGWCTIDKMKRENGEEVFRTIVECDLPPESVFDMFMNATPERKHWDDMCTNELIGDNMYRMHVKMPMVPAYTYNIKLLVRRDFPGPGDVTWVYRAFDPATGELVTSGGAPVGKGCCLAKPGQPNMCTMHSVDELPSMMSYLPAFMVRWMLSFTPKYMVKTLSKYKKHKGL